MLPAGLLSILKTFRAAWTFAELPKSSLSASKTLAAKSCINLVIFILKERKTGQTYLDGWILHILGPENEIGVPRYLREQFGIVAIKGVHDEINQDGIRVQPRRPQWVA